MQSRRISIFHQQMARLSLSIPDRRFTERRAVSLGRRGKCISKTHGLVLLGPRRPTEKEKRSECNAINEVRRRPTVRSLFVEEAS